MLRTLLRPGPAWLIITVVTALFALEITALAVATREVYQTSREEVIRRQQEEITELSTPVVALWQGIVALG